MVMVYSKRTYMKRQFTPQHKVPQPIVTNDTANEFSSRWFVCVGVVVRDLRGGYANDDGRKKKKTLTASQYSKRYNPPKKFI